MPKVVLRLRVVLEGCCLRSYILQLYISQMTTQLLTPVVSQDYFQLCAQCQEAQDEGRAFELKTLTQMGWHQSQTHPSVVVVVVVVVVAVVVIGMGSIRCLSKVIKKKLTSHSLTDR